MEERFPLKKIIFREWLCYSTSLVDSDSGSMSSWCGWHTDHGSLTGLTRAIFTRDTDTAEIPCPDSIAGLYVVYGEDEIAYQIGETTEILSGGQLCATPHCVRVAPKGEVASGVERSTFALFMQPNWDEKLVFPEPVNFHEVIYYSKGIHFFWRLHRKCAGQVLRPQCIKLYVTLSFRNTYVEETQEVSYGAREDAKITSTF
ncbi:hypothetical protein SASPL_112737 [Salvia splendens]|uniref:Isopenicillin N synthase-like Fe(2+) 2OG dioxygenase domain-containing protein n=1 Tax=Salvia splendens TaxID=180675 RepID=A0A8X8YAP1_SALSN|nr:hypothetical protein SASPL_112737 [Salvia splendens]